MFSLITFYKIKTNGFLGYLKGYTEPIKIFTPFNILTELATHYQVKNRDYLYTFITGMLASEFDLEEIVSNRQSSRTFYLNGVAA